MCPGLATSDRLELLVAVLEDGDLDGDQPLCLAEPVHAEPVADGRHMLADGRVDVAGEFCHVDVVPAVRGGHARGSGTSGLVAFACLLVRRALAAAALEAAEEDGVVEIDVTQRSPQELQRVAGQRVGVLGRDT